MVKGFIVYPTYKIENNKSYVHLFGRLENGESFLVVKEYKPYFFIKKSDLSKAKKLFSSGSYEETKLTDFEEHPVVKVVTNIPKDVPTIRQSFENSGIVCYEADMRFAYRFLIDYDIKGSIEIDGKHQKGERVDRVYVEPEIKPIEYFPKNLKTLSIDIETDLKGSKIYCISLYTDDYKKVMMVGGEKLKHAEIYKDEKEMLEAFGKKIIELDPDILTGWNVIDFDWQLIRKRFHHHKIPFVLGRIDWECRLRIESTFFKTSKADFPGRTVLDGIDLLKSSFIRLENYKLNTAAQHFLGEEKLITGDSRHNEIDRLYKEDRQSLVDYNLKDSELVYKIFEASNVLNLTIQRSLLSGMQLDRVSASIASFDNVYLAEARKRGLVAYSLIFTEKDKKTTGGYVKSSVPGIYDYVLVLDFKSLYPSIIRTFNIDPASFVRKGSDDEFVKAPNGALFKNQEGIMPVIIERLWKQRDKAKKDKNEGASYAIKILMNSFYGVLASPNCRFFSPDMANAITHFGHFIIKLTSEKVEERGYSVIYGDTDSIFVVSGKDNTKDALSVGEEIQDYINKFYEAYVKKNYSRKCFLELEFEKTYKRFLMPAIRGTDVGAKKRYAGLLLKGKKEEVDIVGMEYVRGDWTEAAKEFQMHLFDMIFHGKEVAKYVKSFVDDLRAGKFDDKLVYRKSISKDLSEYVKTTPPHVKAARKLDKLEGNKIEYCMTVDGPEPIQKLKNPLDYDHYIDKQIKPIAETVLSIFGKKFEDIVAGHKQSNLFDY